jgi:hypothetical protein
MNKQTRKERHMAVYACAYVKAWPFVIPTGWPGALSMVTLNVWTYIGWSTCTPLLCILTSHPNRIAPLGSPLGDPQCVDSHMEDQTYGRSYAQSLYICTSHPNRMPLGSPPGGPQRVDSKRRSTEGSGGLRTTMLSPVGSGALTSPDGSSAVGGECVCRVSNDAIASSKNSLDTPLCGVWGTDLPWWLLCCWR